MMSRKQMSRHTNKFPKTQNTRQYIWQTNPKRCFTFWNLRHIIKKIRRILSLTEFCSKAPKKEEKEKHFPTSLRAIFPPNSVISTEIRNVRKWNAQIRWDNKFHTPPVLSSVLKIHLKNGIILQKNLQRPCFPLCIG